MGLGFGSVRGHRRGMRGMTKRYLPWLACAVIAAIGVPALAWGESETREVDALVTMGDNFFQDDDGLLSNDAPYTNVVNITPGGRVNFKSIAGANNTGAHNVAVDGATSAIVCNQTVQSPIFP